MNEADNVQVAAAAGRLPGWRLAEARRVQSLTPADVARQLKLSVWQVEALEAGRYQQLPGPIFVRGFIRNYARLLKLDPNELLLEVGDSLPQPAPPPRTAPSPDIPFPGASRSRWPAMAVAAIVIVGGLAAYEFTWNEPGSGTSRTATPSPAPEPGTAPGAVQTVAASGQPAPDAQVTSVEAAQPVMTVATAPQAMKDAPPAAGEARPAQDRLAGPGERRMHLVFDQESWVEIRDRSERIIFSQLNRPGTQQTVSGLPPFSIVVGNARGVRMTYGDKPVDLALHTRTDVARLILQ